MTTIRVCAKSGEYDINIGRGLLSRVDEFFNLNRRVFIITDEGVPPSYAETVKEKCAEGYIFTLPSGEGTKSVSAFEKCLSEMCRLSFSRRDAVVAVGGGVVGDLAGFVSASYMRGIDFYNVPTTTLSALDSSIGGKVAINLGEIKNVVGAFYQPRGVLCDLDTLKSLDKRQFKSGLAEAVKMALTCSVSLFEFFENEEITDANLEFVISEALKIKKAVVEEDERETGLRKILNFGHSYGHAIETLTGMSEYYHGECVALGMIPMCAKSVIERLIRVLKKLSLPTEYTPNFDRVLSVMSHDKKASGDKISAVFVESVGKYEIREVKCADLVSYIKGELI